MVIEGSTKEKSNETGHVNIYTANTRQVYIIRRIMNMLYLICREYNIYLYYKRGEPYLCSAKAPVLDGSGSRR